ncbi:hypothetical protein HMPREF0501_01358 [Limosilactobacillus coleohominis 101-4-CHN]|uniref:Uncharacterized protein n=1 Tax=Limosilactobacillus coleohominis 101-4-CHN TaxID=575594 RepID=C7XX73_9LACO|nr:hypothetical protein [Limosilactobacillus coleohominis]EEU29893.1 hypothetical protein HMPREF0501_01358 [Limosilactobacillus coleohominis 101-4-CHN]
MVLPVISQAGKQSSAETLATTQTSQSLATDNQQNQLPDWQHIVAGKDFVNQDGQVMHAKNDNNVTVNSHYQFRLTYPDGQVKDLYNKTIATTVYCYQNPSGDFVYYTKDGDWAI